jgi:hypothetical protein
MRYVIQHGVAREKRASLPWFVGQTGYSVFLLSGSSTPLHLPDVVDSPVRLALGASFFFVTRPSGKEKEKK